MKSYLNVVYKNVVGSQADLGDLAKQTSNMEPFPKKLWLFTVITY